MSNFVRILQIVLIQFFCQIRASFAVLNFVATSEDLVQAKTSSLFQCLIVIWGFRPRILTGFLELYKIQRTP